MIASLRDRAKRRPRTQWWLTAVGQELLDLVRNHWHIENRLHYVRDFTYDVDRCRAYVRHLPRNLACLSNEAIAIVRCDGRFRHIPEADWHCTDRAQEVLDAIMIAPNGCAPHRHTCTCHRAVQRSYSARRDRKRRPAASGNHRDVGQAGSGLPRTTCSDRARSHSSPALSATKSCSRPRRWRLLPRRARG